VAARDGATFLRIRAQIADFILEKRLDKQWQSIFKTCQEFVPTAGLRAQALLIKGGMGPPTALSPASTTRTKPPLPPPLEPPPTGDVQPESTLPTEALVAALPQPPGAANARKSENFLSWLRSRDPDELALVTQDYWTFKEFEDRWFQEHPRCRVLVERKPARHREQFQLRFRIACGESYRKWRTATGASSRAPLREHCGAKAMTKLVLLEGTLRAAKPSHFFGIGA
jgi:hypothetical protein